VTRVGGETGGREAHLEADLLVVILDIGWGLAEKVVASALGVEEELHVMPLHVVSDEAFSFESVVQAAGIEDASKRLFYAQAQVVQMSPHVGHPEPAIHGVAFEQRGWFGVDADHTERLDDRIRTLSPVFSLFLQPGQHLVDRLVDPRARRGSDPS